MSSDRRPFELIWHLTQISRAITQELNTRLADEGFTDLPASAGLAFSRLAGGGASSGLSAAADTCAGQARPNAKAIQCPRIARSPPSHRLFEVPAIVRKCLTPGRRDVDAARQDVDSRRMRRRDKRAFAPVPAIRA